VQNFPETKMLLPDGSQGNLIPHKLPDDELEKFRACWALSHPDEQKPIPARAF